MPTMKKTEVFLGGDNHRMPVANVRWDDVKETLRGQLGTRIVFVNFDTAKKAVLAAKRHTGAGTTYVKVGLVGQDAVLRIKRPGKVADSETDVVLVKNARTAWKEHQRQIRARVKEEIEQKKVQKTVEEEAQEHLELRAEMVPFTEKLVRDADEVVEEVQKHLGTAQRALEALEKDRTMHNATTATSITRQALSEAKKKVKAFQKSYDERTKSGPLMTSRSDFKKIEKLPEDQQARYKAKSGKLFRQATANVTAVNERLEALTDALAELRTIAEEAASMTSVVSDRDARIESRIEDFASELEKFSAWTARRTDKVRQALHPKATPWGHMRRKPAPTGKQLEAIRKAAKQKLDELEKLLDELDRVEPRFQTYGRRLRALERITEDDDALKQNVAQIAKRLDDIEQDYGDRVPLRDQVDELALEVRDLLGIDV